MGYGPKQVLQVDNRHGNTLNPSLITVLINENIKDRDTDVTVRGISIVQRAPVGASDLTSHCMRWGMTEK